MSPDTITLDDLIEATHTRATVLRDANLREATDDMEPLVAHLNGADLDDPETRLKVERIARLGRKVRTAVAVHVDETRTEWPSIASFGGSAIIRDTAAYSGTAIEVHWATA